MCSIISKINFSILSGGEQLVLSRLAMKEQTGTNLNERERRFIADMNSRELDRMKSKNRYMKV